MDPHMLDHAGLKAEKVIGTHLAETFWWNFSTPAADALRQGLVIARSGRVSQRETIIRPRGAERLPVLLQCKPHRNAAGDVDEIVVVALGLSAEDAAAGLLRGEFARVSTVNRELVHRVKNLFSTVLAALSISYRQTASREELLEMAYSRIAALSKTHLLAVDNGDGPPTTSVSLEELLRAIVGPHLPNENILTTTGYALDIALTDITPLTLILHELATNCTKYGAFCHPDGRLSVEWDCNTEGADGRLSTSLQTLVWKEEFCNPNNEETAEGFGSILLERCLKQIEGKLELRRTPSSYVVKIHF